MGIKQTDICGMCNQEEDFIEHMFLECTLSRKLWDDVKKMDY